MKAIIDLTGDVRARTQQKKYSGKTRLAILLAAIILPWVAIGLVVYAVVGLF